jgi:NTE family protein
MHVECTIITGVQMNLGISLSGGGVRALVFHLGVLARLAETDHWKSLTQISTVSGGSLCIALVFEKAGKKWPDSETYLNDCLPAIYKVLTEHNIQRMYVRDLFLRPWKLFQGRAHVIGSLIAKHWGVTSDIADIPIQPQWTINTTCYETGKNFRFSAKKMGDYKTEYVFDPRYSLADAVAASAAVPGLIGPLKMKASKFKWHKFRDKDTNKPTYPIQPIGNTLTLWDGCMYDNLGVEFLYKPNEGLQEGINFYLVSDASSPLGIVKRKWLAEYPLPRSPMRIVDIPMDQVRSLRSRLLFGFFHDTSYGGYIRIGESVPKILKNLKYSDLESVPVDKCLNPNTVENIAEFKTTLRKLNAIEFSSLFRHGYETCNAVLVGTDKAPFSIYNAANFIWGEIDA